MPRPLLMRIARWLQLAGTVTLVLLLVFLATVGYSAYRLGVSSPSNGSSQTAFGHDVVTLTRFVNLTNGGLYPITGLTFDVLTHEVGGPMVGRTAGPAMSVGAGTTDQVPIVITVSVAPGSAGQPLLISGAWLDISGWLNGTFGYVLSVSVGVNPSCAISWAPPFSGFGVRVTSVGPAANVTVSFTDASPLPVGGTMTVALASATGANCGTPSLPIDAPAQGSHPYSASVGTTLAAGCTPATAVASLVAPAGEFAFTLPEVTIT